MKFADDFRYIAREALRGKWSVAVIAGLIASLLGGLSSDQSQVKLDIDLSDFNVKFSLAGQTIFSSNGGLGEFGPLLTGGIAFITLAVLAAALLFFVLGSIIEVGYARFNLNLVDRTEANIEALFGYFNNWKTTVCARLLQSIYILLWTFALIIPGIIASYSYAMTSYILAEHPELTASEAITRSKEMMYGNRFRLFCLQLSFIGWDILCIFTLGIGHLWLTPYKQAATAAFYREISGTGYQEAVYQM